MRGSSTHFRSEVIALVLALAAACVAPRPAHPLVDHERACPPIPEGGRCSCRIEYDGEDGSGEVWKCISFVPANPDDYRVIRARFLSDGGIEEFPRPQ